MKMATFGDTIALADQQAPSVRLFGAARWTLAATVTATAATATQAAQATQAAHGNFLHCVTRVNCSLVLASLRFGQAEKASELDQSVCLFSEQRGAKASSAKAGGKFQRRTAHAECV